MMKFFNVLLVALVLFFNLIFSQPSWADLPPIETNADYIELTKTLDDLAQAKDSETPPEGLSLADVEQKITELSYQNIFSKQPPKQ